MKYPKKEKIAEILNEITDEDFSELLPEDASNVDRTKYELCRKFVSYLREEGLSQAELARRISTDRSRINWIVKYKIENFTIDRLYELWAQIEPEFELKVS